MLKFLLPLSSPCPFSFRHGLPLQSVSCSLPLCSCLSCLFHLPFCFQLCPHPGAHQAQRWAGKGEVEERRAPLIPVPCLGSRADKGAPGPHTLGPWHISEETQDKEFIQKGWGEWREKEQGDRHRHTDTERNRDRENIQGEMRQQGQRFRDRESETKGKSRERQGQRQRPKGQETCAQRHDGLPCSPLPSHLAAFPDSPGTRSMCWGPRLVAGARGTASWSQSRSTGSGGPWAWQLRLKGVLAVTALSSGSSRK